MPRILPDWIDSYLQFTEEHESPEVFHKWTAVVMVASAARANVWMDRGRYEIFPNQYVIFVSDSAFLRRSVAQKIGVNTFLRKVPDVFVFSDRVTPEGVLDAVRRVCVLPDGRKREESTALVWAPELPMMFGGSDVTTRSTAIWLTDVYEGKKEHQHTTRAGGHQKYFNHVVNFFGSTAPDWLENLPEEMIGGGFTGRIHFVTATQRKRAIAWPTPGLSEFKLKQPLLDDLIHISRLQGEMKPSRDAHALFKDWYEYDLPTKKLRPEDFRAKPYFERIHDHALKLAMVYSLSESDSLVVEKRHLERAIKDVSIVLSGIKFAISTLGATDFHKIAEKVYQMIESAPPIGCKHSDLLRAISYRLDGPGFNQIIQLLIDQNRIEIKPATSKRTPTRYIVVPQQTP